MGGGGQNGNQGAGGGAGGFQQQAQANGEALVDLIEKTIAPESWDINGGPGSIVYYGNFHARSGPPERRGPERCGQSLQSPRPLGRFRRILRSPEASNVDASRCHFRLTLCEQDCCT